MVFGVLSWLLGVYGSVLSPRVGVEPINVWVWRGGEDSGVGPLGL